MKLPRYSLRTLLIAVAIIAAVVGWVRYESQRGLTVEKFVDLIEREVDPNSDSGTFDRWVYEHGFYGPREEGRNIRNYNDYPWPNSHNEISVVAFAVGEDREANLGWFQKFDTIWACFFYDRNRKFIRYSIFKAGDRECVAILSRDHI
jgi:hypothetical protein